MENFMCLVENVRLIVLKDTSGIAKQIPGWQISFFRLIGEHLGNFLPNGDHLLNGFITWYSH